MPSQNQKPVKITPNIERILVKLLTSKHIFANDVNMLVPGQLKAGENLLYGEVIDGGNTKFKTGTRVYYSEFSSAALFRLGQAARGQMTLGEVMKEENRLYVIAEDDIMAFEEEGEQYESESKPISAADNPKPSGIFPKIEK